MKTLDEVIKALEEYITDDEIENILKQEILFYLKEYKTEQENSLLTWDELKQMEKKPVWIESITSETSFQEWVIVQEVSDKYAILFGSLFGMNYSKEKYGTNWKAYKKEQNN